MKPKILVAYGSKYGATAEVAKVIGDRCASAGFEVDVWPAQDVRDVEQYVAVIVGSAIYGGRWRNDAVRVLKRHRRALVDRPTWLFSGPLDRQAQIAPEPLPKKVADLAGVIGVRDAVTFGDGADPHTFMARTMADAGEGLDLSEVRRWADAMAGDLSRSQSAA
jgi:menaquinone-dependent protoporphyrinogen oxidase